VTLHSGRTLVGDFTCLDPQGNIILVNTCELVKSSSDPKGLTERTMGMVLIPQAQQARVELQVGKGSRARGRETAGGDGMERQEVGAP
jgi:small nuclear ribonucleoprotein (snRNP)-like protein